MRGRPRAVVVPPLLAADTDALVLHVCSDGAVCRCEFATWLCAERWAVAHCSTIRAARLGASRSTNFCGVSVCSERYFAGFFSYALVATKRKFRPHPRCAIWTLAWTPMIAMAEVGAEAEAEAELEA